jgi:histone H3/H4
MSDREFGGNDDLSLPKGAPDTPAAARRPPPARRPAHADADRAPATVQKIVQDILATEPGMTFAKDSRDLLIECCVEFITLISSEANEIAEKDAKKTIACEHVKAALEELDFGEYVPAILDVAADYKKTQQVRPTPPHPTSISTAPLT